jgi:hypothetical protein
MSGTAGTPEFACLPRGQCCGISDNPQMLSFSLAGQPPAGLWNEFSNALGGQEPLQEQKLLLINTTLSCL